MNRRLWIEGGTLGFKNAAYQNRRTALENDFLEGALTKAGLLNAKKMLDPAHELSLTKQATTLGISRGSISYLPQPVNDGGRV